MKSTSQNNKYIRFLTFSTLFSLSLFLLNLAIDSDTVQMSIPNSNNAITTDIVKGDIDPLKESTKVLLKEQTQEYQIEKFWESFAENLLKFSPSVLMKENDGGSLNVKNSRPPACELETNLIDPVYDGHLYSEEFLGKCLKLPYNRYISLKELHSQFVHSMPLDYGVADKYYQGDGIIMIGGGKYSVMTQLVISILRERGTTLPIEVMIPYGEEDESFCQHLEKQNAKCIRPIISESVWKALHIKSYQTKIVALISTSFANVLYLDSDNYPLHKLDDIFEIEPYLETGFVSWPDFWRRSTSPAYYQIVGSKVGGRVRNNIDEFSPVLKYSHAKEDVFSKVPYHDREGTIPDGSSETSAILINKYKHAQTLMLSFYYNLNGPDFYYYLLSQGNFGEGDKETFVAAANYLQKPYYQLKTKPAVGGTQLHGGKTPRGPSMIQFDPATDYKLSLQLKEKFGDQLSKIDSKKSKLKEEVKIVEEDEVYDLTKVTNFFNDNNKKLLFLHYNLGKMDPLHLQPFKERRYGYDLTMVGFDFEFRNMELMNDMLCSTASHHKIEFDYLKNSIMSEICDNLKEILQKMSETSKQVIV